MPRVAPATSSSSHHHGDLDIGQRRCPSRSLPVPSSSTSREFPPLQDSPQLGSTPPHRVINEGANTAVFPLSATGHRIPGQLCPGFDATSMDRVAQAAGVSRATISGQQRWFGRRHPPARRRGYRDRGDR
ncbi:TetR/AcrR family transcriptional regulator [Synechococcus sp. EJ6-Ellesmere]|uniref:TetR/AcrR family transcriptional regulator n=1 Tax=Synechococcus sp. EJ6-Ellesmere TaxID=2823734 RepID=UPI0037DA4A75